MSGKIVNFNANTANTASNLNDGSPQVSILASASAKRMQEKRRQSRLLKSTKGMGVGKKYPGVGTHHRNTKHVWLFSELAEVSAAYKEHHTMMPCWKIANMLYYSFGEQLKHYQANIAEVDQQDQPIAQLREPRTHLPSIQAIQAKLMDCITLQYKDSLGYASQPTQMHKQVWEHLELSEKHRTMLKQMSALSQPLQQTHSAQPSPILQDQDQDQDQDRKPLWNVHARDFLFNTDAEYEATLPPAKRRKVEFVEEEEESALQQQQQQQQQQQIKQEDPVASASKADFDAGIAELVGLMGEVDNARRQEHALIQRLVSQIRQHNHRIGALVSDVKDSHAEIERHRKAIEQDMQQIESIIAPIPDTTPTAATATTTAAATATAAFDPNHYQCRECTEMFNPLVPGFWLIGPNRETGDTFYLCSECTSFMEPTTPRASDNHDNDDNDEDHSDDCGDGDCDCWDDVDYDYDYDSDGLDDQPKQGDYDHAEECS